LPLSAHPGGLKLPCSPAPNRIQNRPGCPKALTTRVRWRTNRMSSRAASAQTASQKGFWIFDFGFSICATCDMSVFLPFTHDPPRSILHPLSHHHAPGGLRPPLAGHVASLAGRCAVPEPVTGALDEDVFKRRLAERDR